VAWPLGKLFVLEGSVGWRYSGSGRGRPTTSLIIPVVKPAPIVTDGEDRVAVAAQRPEKLAAAVSTTLWVNGANLAR